MTSETESPEVSGVRFPHGYTNHTAPVGAVQVRKSYSGSDSAVRTSIEAACLAGLRGRLPVPRIIARDGDTTLLERLPGRHGQDLIDEGYGYQVMHAAGACLRELQAVPPDVIVGLSGDGDVIVHGDFGPQNMLFDRHHRVTALLDWEFAHRGDVIEDLAWAEWIVRMHHAAEVQVVLGLFTGYGSRPPWRRRHAAMLDRCRQLLGRCAREGQPAAAKVWSQRIQVTGAWEELPL